MNLQKTSTYKEKAANREKVNQFLGRQTSLSPEQLSRRLANAREDSKAVLAKVSEATGIDWHSVISLPTFQQFLAEQKGLNLYQSGRPLGRCLDEGFISELHSKEAADLYEAYCKWHTNKGCWRNETPKGRLIDDLIEPATR